MGLIQKKPMVLKSTAKDMLLCMAAVLRALPLLRVYTRDNSRDVEVKIRAIHITRVRMPTFVNLHPMARHSYGQASLVSIISIEIWRLIRTTISMSPGVFVRTKTILPIGTRGWIRPGTLMPSSLIRRAGLTAALQRFPQMAGA